MFQLRQVFPSAALLALAISVISCTEQAQPEAQVLHTDPAGAIEITLTPLDTSGAETTIGALQFISGYVLSADHDTFGGLSGLTITSDDRLLALEDVGLLVSAEIVMDANSNKLIGLTNAQMISLAAVDGTALNPPPYDSEEVERCPSSIADVSELQLTIGQHDSEGIALGLDGSRYVSFERHHRIVHYGLNGTDLVPLPDEVSRAPCNASLEALAVLPSGDLLVISEGIHFENQDLMAWLVSDTETLALRYPYKEGFRPTGLAALPNGDALVVERFFTPAIGNKARVLKIPATSITAGGMLEVEELAFFNGQNFPIDNFEGIAIRPTGSGAIDIFMVSDHNFSPERQRTLLVQFRIAADMSFKSE